MDFSRIKISSFTSIESYCHLQSYFQSLDVRENPNEYPKILEPVNNLRIIYNSIDDVSGELINVDLSFNKDYCYDGLENISKKYIHGFLSYIEDKAVHEASARSALVEARLNTLREWKVNICKAKYIAYPIIIRLRDEIEILENHLSEYLENPLPNINYKIQFNWNRTDTIYLFYLLRVNGAIAEIADADIGRILDAVVEYQNDNGEYKSISRSRKALNDYRNQGGKPEGPANIRLQQVFSGDFFNV